MRLIFSRFDMIDPYGADIFIIIAITIIIISSSSGGSCSVQLHCKKNWCT